MSVPGAARLAAVGLAIGLATGVAPGSEGGGAAAGFEVADLGSGVHAVVRKEPPGIANHANNLFILGPDDVVVVDTPFTLAATREVIAALRLLTPKPVRALVLTHWHDDHAFGAEVYRDSFPGIEIIASEATAADLAGIAVENRRRQVEGGAGALAALTRAAARDTAFDGLPMDDGDRAAYASTIALARAYLAEAPTVRTALPTTTFRDRMTLRQGDRLIEIRTYGAGNTSGDAVVWLPASRILAAGDLVQRGPPSAAHAAVGPWIATLDSLAALAPRRIVPGHGRIEFDAAAIERLRGALLEVREEVRAGVARGETLEQLRADARLAGPRATLAGDDKFARFFFDGWFAGPAVTAAYREATAPPSDGPGPR